MGRSKEKQREYMRAWRAKKKAEAQAADCSPGRNDPARGVTTTAGATPQPGRHVAAVARMLSESGLSKLDEEGPLVELLRDLAAELDQGANARTRQQYLTALRDARRVLAAAPGVPGAGGKDAAEPVAPVSDEPEAPAVDPEVADFESFRRAKGSASHR